MVSTCNVLLLALTSLLMYTLSDSCSCMTSHPQEHYCSADFVAVVQVRRARKGNLNVTAYQIRTKKLFKAHHKAEAALKHGLLWSNARVNSCGLHLNKTRYLVTGHVIGEKPWVSLCNFVQEWSALTRKQRKGFRRLYQQGCQCKVRASGYVQLFTARHYSKGHYCSWETAWMDNSSDCQGRHTMCVPSIHNKGKCFWVHNSAYRHCMKRNRKLKETRRRRP